MNDVFTYEFETFIFQEFIYKLKLKTCVISFPRTFGIPNNRLDIDNLTPCDHNSLCGGESLMLALVSNCYQEFN